MLNIPCFVTGAIDLESAEIQIQINDEKDIKELTPKKVCLYYFLETLFKSTSFRVNYLLNEKWVNSSSYVIRPYVYQK